MGEGAQRHEVYSWNGRIDQNCGFVDAPGHLELGAAGDLDDRLAHPFGAHVVQQQARSAGREGRVDLVGVAHLDGEREVRPRGSP